MSRPASSLPSCRRGPDRAADPRTEHGRAASAHNAERHSATRQSLVLGCRGACHADSASGRPPVRISRRARFGASAEAVWVALDMWRPRGPSQERTHVESNTCRCRPKRCQLRINVCPRPLSSELVRATAAFTRSAISVSDMANHYTLAQDEQSVMRLRAIADSAIGFERPAWLDAGVGPGSRVLEVGCGPVALLGELAMLVGASGEACRPGRGERAALRERPGYAACPADRSRGRTSAPGAKGLLARFRGARSDPARLPGT